MQLVETSSRAVNIYSLIDFVSISDEIVFEHFGWLLNCGLGKESIKQPILSYYFF